MQTHVRPGAHDGLESFHMAPAPRLPDDVEAFDFGKYLGILRRRWALILVCVLLAAVYAFVRYSLTTREYRSMATIQIERKRLSLLALGQAGWLEDWWNMEYYPTQYRLLRSRGMAERVVKNLRLYDNPAFTGRAASLLPQVGSEPAAEQLSSVELAALAGRVRGGLKVNPIEGTQLVELSYVSTNPDLAAQIANAYAEVFIEWGIETRNTTVGQASNYLSAQIETLNHEIEERQKQLNAVLSQSDFALDPAGEALLNRRATLEQRYNEVMAQRIGLHAGYQEILSMSEATVANTHSAGRVATLKSELSSREREYQENLGIYTPEWPDMRRLKEEIDNQRGQLERLIAEKYNEEKDRAYAKYQKAKREEDSLESELRKLAADARLQNSAALEYTNQKTYITTRKELRADLVKRHSETEVASRVQTSQESNVRIVDRAVAASCAFRPTLKSSLSQTVLVGFLAGVAGIVLLEFMDRTIKTPEELERVLGIPTLAVIPDLRKGRGGGLRYRFGKKGYGYAHNYGYGHGYGSDRSEGPAGGSKGKGTTSGDDSEEAEKAASIELLPHHSPRLAVCEAYRSLRTGLLLSSAEEVKIIAVTSAEPGEGKTVTVINLGVVLAQLDRRVLIIDADLRRPRMHRVFDLSNKLGLVNYITSNAVDFDDLVLATSVPNLVVCPSGPIPPNPSELLASDRLHELLGALRARYDFILLDTPPTAPVTDAIILGRHTDGLVICARAGVLQRESAKLCRERLTYADLRVFGSVLNRYRASAGDYYRGARYYGSYLESGPSSPAESAA